MNNAPLQALVTINQHNIALMFSDYLQSLDIQAEVKNTADGYIIYCASDKVEHAQAEFEQFIKQPNNKKYQQAAWQHGQINNVQQHSPDFLSTFKQQFLEHAGIITLVVFSLCWIVFIASIAGWSNDIFYALQFYPNFSLDSFLSQPLRILGPALFHFSWLHIVFNTMWWWQLGGSIERTLGGSTLLIIFAVSAIVSNAGQYFVSGPNFGGLSGVVYALVGYVWWLGWLVPSLGLSMTKPIIGFLLFWIVLGFADLLPVDMANTAHLLGLVSGCALAWLKATQLKYAKR